MLIGELSRRTGVSCSAIRFYEQERLIPEAARLSGRRVFDQVTLDQLVVVQLAKDAGFTLAEIRQLVNEFGENRWRRLARRKLGEIRGVAQRLQAMTALLEKLLRCKCPDIEFCGRAIQRHRAAQSSANRDDVDQVSTSRTSRKRR